MFSWFMQGWSLAGNAQPVITLVFTFINVTLTCLTFWRTQRNRPEADWTVSVCTDASKAFDFNPVRGVAACAKSAGVQFPLVLVVTNSGDGPGYRVKVDGINVSACLISDVVPSMNPNGGMAVYRSLDCVRPGERFFVALSLESMYSSSGDTGVRILWTPQPTRLERTVYKEYAALGSPLPKARRIRTTRRPLLLWGSLLSGSPRPIVRLVQLKRRVQDSRFAHRIKTLFTTLTSFRKKGKNIDSTEHSQQ
ncbi:hypothetical protein [Bifidobacterium pseudolongum]|uniref:hypothetical protein n=1 Tax=Bifidobacterium pseudolongum TaxID=1694 RepID=UPI001021B3E4|nr:hypothetical protein [Bifidobacterium pseudolongum]